VTLAREVNSKNASRLKGTRLGGGTALCVLTPTMLQEVVDALQVIVDAGGVVIPQGANTGLTGGSVPRADTTDSRPVVVMSMAKLDTIFPIDHGERTVCLAGAGIASLSQNLGKWFPSRESHSVLGSFFLNPTAAAGVALGSGGTQLRKGPAYTDRALYLKVLPENKWGERHVQIVNTLGIDGISTTDPSLAVEQLDTYQHDVKNGYIRAMAKSDDTAQRVHASDVTYKERICKLDSNVSRCNADTRGADCNRSEGKVLILATVHDTFAKPLKTRTFWVSFSTLQQALDFRSQVCLNNPTDVPMSVEYMDRDAFDVIDRSGRALANLILLVGMESPIIKTLWNVKVYIETSLNMPLFCDTMLHMVSPWMPVILPTPMQNVGGQMDHHVSVTVGEYVDPKTNEGGTLDRFLGRMETFAKSQQDGQVVIHECKSSREAARLTAFRFVAAPAFKTWCVGENLQGTSVDYALPKNGGAAPIIPKDNTPAQAQPVKRMRYSHFGCNVVHEDLAYDLNVNVHDAKLAFKKIVEHQSGGKLPAEHGHGTEYHAPPETQKRWKRMDPLNIMNPGVGGLSTHYKYQDENDKP